MKFMCKIETGSPVWLKSEIAGILSLVESMLSLLGRIFLKILCVENLRNDIKIHIGTCRQDNILKPKHDNTFYVSAMNIRIHIINIKVYLIFY